MVESIVMIIIKYGNAKDSQLSNFIVSVYCRPKDQIIFACGLMQSLSD